MRFWQCMDQNSRLRTFDLNRVEVFHKAHNNPNTYTYVKLWSGHEMVLMIDHEKFEEIVVNNEAERPVEQDHRQSKQNRNKS